MAGKLQEGIYHAPGVQPPAFFGILFLRAERDLQPGQVRETFLNLWSMYLDLKAGNVKDLPGHSVPPGELKVLVGLGPNLFKEPHSKQALPAELKEEYRFRSPVQVGGGPLLVGSGLRYANDVQANIATEDIVVQFTAETQLAVNRAIVETWKALQDLADPNTGTAPLQMTGFFTGFQRDDGRSWIDFHDGVSNMKSSEREGAICIKPTAQVADKWTEGGTYMAFVRVGVDLTVWRALTRRQQEALVGRDKLSGCPLAEISEQGSMVGQAGCPIAGTNEVIAQGNSNFREPPSVGNAILRQSHVQRANQHVTPISDRNSLRIFRQGYEFLEPLEVAPGFRTGLNFVSFQDTPERLFRMLYQPGWLGGTNFGGDPANPLPGMERLLTVRAAAIYLIPPITDGEAFPGAGILS